MKAAKVRITAQNWIKLQDLLFSEYPKKEVATFLDCGWKEGNELLILTIKSINIPRLGDIESGVDAIQLNEQYSMRQALLAEKGKFAIGLVHSHPEGYGVWPSMIDDKMDEYYSEYFKSFAPERPFLSMIISKNKDGIVKFSGRLFWHGKWLQCLDLQVVGESCERIYSSILDKEKPPQEILDRLSRLTGAMGHATAVSLWGSKVVIIGAGGTGSALFHSLVRACVGEIVIIDDDTVSISNSERLHGFEFADILDTPASKVDIMVRLAGRINPLVKVTALRMNANTEEALKHIVECDIIFGCTDSQVGKVLVSNISHRYLLPAIHVNVSMETAGGKLNAEVVQVVRYGPDLPCVYCRNLVNSQLFAQELMSPEERQQRKSAASQYVDERKQMYWVDEPVLHTVGSTTTIAAEYAAKMGIGLMCGAVRFIEDFFEFDVLKPSQGAVAFPMKKRKDCICSHDICGSADQGTSWL